MDNSIAIYHPMSITASAKLDALRRIDAIHATAEVVFAPFLDALQVDLGKVAHFA